MMYARTQKKTWKAVLVLVTGAALALLFRRFLTPTLTLTAGAAALAQSGVESGRLAAGGYLVVRTAK